MSDRLRRLVRSPALWLGVAYLALIPIFAAVYSGLPPGSFHDSNAQRENGAYEDAKGLRASLAWTITAHLRRLTWTTGGGRLALDPDTVEVGSLEYTPQDHLLIEVRGSYGPAGKSRLAVGTFVLWVEPFVCRAR